MRRGETEQVSNTLKGLGVRFKVVPAEKMFFAALKGVVDPEKKRAIIGKKFIEVFETEAERFHAEFLVQGTIAPDWIESGGPGPGPGQNPPNRRGPPPEEKPEN